MKKLVSFNINSGEFSNSWTSEEMVKVFGEDLYNKEMEEHFKYATEKGYKLIQYECINDPNFDFYNMMKVVSNLKSK